MALDITPMGKRAVAVAWVLLAILMVIVALSVGSVIAVVLLLISAGMAFWSLGDTLRHYGLGRGRRIAVALVSMLGAMVAIGAQSPKQPAAIADATTSPAADPSPVAAKPKPDAAAEQAASVAAKKRAFLAQYRQIMALAQPCDQSIGAVAKAAGSGSSIATYAVARDGQDACQSAWLAIDKMSPSVTGGDVEKKQAKAIKTCASAYFLRERAMETAMKVANGDGKPSDVVSIQDDLKAGQSGVMMCVAEWMMAGTALGVQPADMK